MPYTAIKYQIILLIHQNVMCRVLDRLCDLKGARLSSKVRSNACEERNLILNHHSYLKKLPL